MRHNKKINHLSRKKAHLDAMLSNTVSYTHLTLPTN